MNPQRFDTLARSLTGLGSRRRALAAVLGGSLGLLGGHGMDDTAAHDLKKKCKKKSGDAKKKCLKKAKKHRATHASEPTPALTCTPSCGACQVCSGGACLRANDNAPCGGDGTGRCLNGGCVPKPQCAGTSSACTQRSQCCSNDCAAVECFPSYFGQRCLTTNDCNGGFQGSCVGYQCTYSTCPPTADFCANGTPTCGNGGSCLRPFDGGVTRCGANGGSVCNCTSHGQCVDALGNGAFCAAAGKPGCACSSNATATTFCAQAR